MDLITKDLMQIVEQDLLITTMEVLVFLVGMMVSKVLLWII